MKKLDSLLYKSTFLNVQGKTLHVIEFGSQKQRSKAQRIKKLTNLQQTSLNHSMFGPAKTR